MPFKILALRFYGSASWTTDIILKTYLYAINAGTKIMNTSYNVDQFYDDYEPTKAAREAPKARCLNDFFLNRYFAVSIILG